MNKNAEKSTEDTVNVNAKATEPRNPIHNSLKYITLVRSVYAVLVLVYCIIWLSRIGWKSLDNDAWLLLGSVVEIFAFTTLCCVVLIKRKFVQLVTYIGMVHDSVLAAIFVLCTGLATSPFFYLFLIVPLYGGIILQRKGGLIGATIVSVVMVMLLYVAPVRLAVWLSLPNSNSINIFRPFFLLYLILAAYCVGFLTGHLSHLYASVSDSLVQADIEFSHLKGVYAVMLNALPIGILIISPESKRVLYHNPRAEQLLGTDLIIPKPMNTSVELKSISHIEPEYSREDIGKNEHDKNVLDMSLQAGNDVPPVEWTSVLNGKYLHIAQFTMLLHKSCLLGYHIIDFTAQYQAQKERAQRARLMHLGEFSAKVAHEIRNPLACISGCNEMLQLDAHDEEQIQIHEMMNGEINRLNHLLNDILVFSRKPKLSPKSFSLKKLVESQRERFLEACGHKENIHFELNIDGDIEICADESSFRQILMTLWQNAGEAMNWDGVISISAVLPLEIEVSDSGPGVSKEEVSRIFEPFYTTKSEGTGLGLAAAHQLAGDNGFNLSWSEERKSFLIVIADEFNFSALQA